LQHKRSVKPVTVIYRLTKGFPYTSRPGIWRDFARQSFMMNFLQSMRT